MPSITYIIRFTRREWRPGQEDQEYTSLAVAWESFRLFAEPDSAELYRRIKLIAHNWEECAESTIAAIDFAEPYSW